MDHRLGEPIAGLLGMAPTLKFYFLNDDGTLGDQLLPSSGFIHVPPVRRVLGLAIVKHAVPASSDFAMDCGARR